MHWLDSRFGSFFVPIIIKICHWFDFNQYQVYRHSYTLAAMMIFPQVWRAGIWIGTAFVTIMMISFTLSSVFLNDTPTKHPGTPEWRVICVLLSIFTTINSALIESWDMGNIALWLIPLAEYARAIDRIPPRESEKKVTYVRA